MLALKEDTMLGNIPGDWAVKPLKALLKEQHPGDWGTEGGPHMYRVIRSTNLTNNGHLNLSDVASRALKPEKAAHLELRKNDILLERSGGGPDQPVGRVGFVKEDMPGSAFSNFLHMLRPDPEQINPLYLKWVLWRINQTGRIVRLEQQTTQLRNLHFRDYLTMSLPIPPPAEQVAIAQVLDAVDTAIECMRTAIGQAEELDHSILHELLGQNAKNKPVKEWPLTRVDAVAVVDSGLTLGKDVTGFKSVTRPYLRVANVQDGHLNLDTIKFVSVRQSEVEKYELQPGDVLMTEGGDFDKLGRGALWDGQLPGCLHQNHVFRVRANQALLDPRYFACVVESDIAKAYFNRVAKRTTNLASTNKTQVRAFRFPLPTLSEQQRIADTVAATKAKVRTLCDKQQALQTLKAALLQDLLTGKVRAGALAATETLAPTV